MKAVKDVIISTVVPSVLYTLQHLSLKYFHRKAIVIGAGIKTGIVVKYDNPKQVGSDRIVNAVAAHAKYGGPSDYNRLWNCDDLLCDIRKSGIYRRNL